uniref:Non-haem dioxygenase N-terminal domain-containing protein n=1 Tax=Aegilops tauschii subsp. strangulata TaxID=200361 RepID=A0A453GVZ6_AEGTS
MVSVLARDHALDLQTPCLCLSSHLNLIDWFLPMHCLLIPLFFYIQYKVGYEHHRTIDSVLYPVSVMLLPRKEKINRINFPLGTCCPCSQLPLLHTVPLLPCLCLQLINHGVLDDVLEGMKASIQEFFGLPAETKKRLAQQRGQLERSKICCLSSRRIRSSTGLTCFSSTLCHLRAGTPSSGLTSRLTSGIIVIVILQSHVAVSLLFNLNYYSLRPK